MPGRWRSSQGVVMLRWAMARCTAAAAALVAADGAARNTIAGRVYWARSGGDMHIQWGSCSATRSKYSSMRETGDSVSKTLSFSCRQQMSRTDVHTPGYIMRMRVAKRIRSSIVDQANLTSPQPRSALRHLPHKAQAWSHRAAT